MENPRRICAGCGEINLPDGTAPQPLAFSAPRLKPWKREPLQVLVGAAAPLLPTALMLLITVVGGTYRGSLVGSVVLSRLSWLFPLAILLSFGACVWETARPGARAGWSGFFWITGVVTGATLSTFLASATSLLMWWLEH